MTALAPASVLAGYRIDSVLGNGGMGTVYRAWDLRLDRPVALKVIAESLTGDATFRKRFQREAIAAAAIDHPNVVPVYEAGEADGRMFIAMRLVDGSDWSTVIAREAPLDPARAVAVANQIAAALDAAHARGLIHRDVKPANVLVEHAVGHAYLTDFGIARRLRARTHVTKPGVFVGTIDYIAPEVIRGDTASRAVDIYALGCMLFESLTGQVPFARDDEVAVAVAHRDEEPPRLREFAQVPDELQAVLDRALAKEPGDRHATAGELGRAALAAMAGAAPERPRPRPTTASPVRAEARAAVVPPSLARHIGAGPFVGRGGELATLSEAWERAAGGELTAVLLSGEPGIGKTRLVAELARKLVGEGARAVYGRADEEVAPPFGPVTTVLRQLVDSAEDDILRAHVAAHGGELGRLVPELSRRVPDLPAPRVADPDTERLSLREAAVGLIASAAARRPTLLVLDDVHWADRASLGLLLHLLQGPDAPLFVLATYRATAADQRPPLREVLGDLSRDPRAERLELDGLSKRDVTALAALALGRPAEEVPEALATRVHAETEGNALFATEVLRQLAGSADDPEAIDAAAEEGVGIPQTVRDIVLQRLEQLDPSVGEIVVPAAIIGQSFGADLLTAVTQQPEDTVLERLDRAREAALVGEYPDSPGQFFFRHALIQAALSETLGLARRRRLHGRIAEELETRTGTDVRSLGERARHWVEAGDNEHALPACVNAGDAALALLAPDEAMRWYAQALDLHERHGEADQHGRAELLIKLGEAERRAGSDAFRERLLEAGRLALQLGDADRLARAALANNRGMHSRTGLVDTERLELLEAALALPDLDDSKRALLLATISSELWSGDYGKRKELSDQALEVARRVGDERILAEVIYRRCFALAEPATLEERLVLTEELLELTDRSGDVLMQLLASVERSRAAMESCRLDEAVFHAERQGELAKECGDAYGRHGAGWAMAWPHALAGRYEQAQAAADAALQESMGSAQPDAIAFYGAQIAVIWWDQGKLGELADGIVMQAESPEGLSAHHALATLALAEAGRLDEARAKLDVAVGDGIPVPTDTIWLTVNMIWGEAAILCDYEPAAPILLERLLPWRDQVAFTGLAVHGAAARVAAELAAMLGRDDAGELFEQAERIHEQIEAPAFLARTRAGWARWLAARGETARAATLIEGARFAATACGCPHLAQVATSTPRRTSNDIAT